MTTVVGLLVLALVALVLVVAVRASLRRHGRDADAAHDDSLRAGPGVGIDRSEAAQRAANLNAWMRPGGGSG